LLLLLLLLYFNAELSGTFGKNGSLDGYFGDSGYSPSYPEYNISVVMSSPAWKSIASVTRPTTAAEVRELRRRATVHCNNETSRRDTNCNPSVTNMACLFNIYTDPCEENDLSTTNPDIATKMYDVLLRHNQFLIPQLNKPSDITGADPAKFSDTWTCWLD
jgi:hypothetical protein